MKRQRCIHPVKECHRNLQNQTKEEEIRSLLEKRIQNNDSEDDPKSWNQGSSWSRDRTHISCIAGGFFLSYWGSFLYMYAAAAAKSLQSCPTLCDPPDGSPPGSPIPGILRARTLEWVAISFSNAWKWKVKVKSLSHVQVLATPWTAAHQAPPSMGFSRQEYWSGVPLPSLLYMYIYI